MSFYSATTQTHCHLSTSPFTPIVKVSGMEHFGLGVNFCHKNIIPGIFTWTSEKFIGIQWEALNTLNY